MRIQVPLLAVLLCSIVGGCTVDATQDARSMESTGTTQQALTLTGFPEDLHTEHTNWHMSPPTQGGRKFPMGSPGSGAEFLAFHRTFVPRALAWYFAQPNADHNAVAPWHAVPDELKNDPATGWFNDPSLAAIEQRLNNNAFSSADELGIAVEGGIHAWLHYASSRHFGDANVGSIMMSPLSSYFYQIHGLIDYWWARWEQQTRYQDTSANDRYWSDSAGNVYHQNQWGDVDTVFRANGQDAAAGSMASYSYPVGGRTVWFLDRHSPAHLRQVWTDPSGINHPSDWGGPPAGCSSWLRNPAVSSWGEGRADMYLEARCNNGDRLFHESWDGTTHSWQDITPPGVQLASSPAVVARSIAPGQGALDVIVMSSNMSIVHGACYGACADVAKFAWDAPSPRMQQGSSTWFGEPALASPSPGVLRAFSVDWRGNIDFSDSSLLSPAWTPSASWGAPSQCFGLPGGPAVTRSGQNNLFVACTTYAEQFFGGWGDKSLHGTWWYMGSNLAAGGALSSH